MLRVRPDQLEALQFKDDAHFVGFLVDHLREDYAEIIDSLAPEEAREMVANGVARARRHGIRRRDDVAAFVSLMFEIAPNFDAHPALAGVLDDPALPPTARLDALFDESLAEAWQEAEAAYDRDAWFRVEP